MSQYTIEGDTLVIRIPLNTVDPPPSKSRKTLVVGTTNGFQETGIPVMSGPLADLILSVSANVTVPRPKAQRGRRWRGVS